MELTEAVRRAQAGDQEAMGELYRQTNQRVYALALRLTRNPELAMDAVQDTYVSALGNLDQLREPAAVLHWLFQIAANRCRKLQRREGRYVQPQQDEEDQDFFETIPDPDEKLLPEAAADTGETRRLLWELIDSLPQAQRECMILFYFSQFTVEQIAKAQDCSEGTVKSRLNYGRKKLKECVLALESREGIRLHTLAPVGLLFRLTAGELPDPNTLLHIWHNVAAQLGAAGAAAGGAGIAAAAGNGSAAAGGTAAAKGAAAGALKIKIAATVAAGAIAVGGAAMVLHQPSVTFSDPAFEQNIRVLLDQPTGAIHSADLEALHVLFLLEDGMTTTWGQEGGIPEAEAGTTAVSSLEDLSLLTGLTSLNYLVPDGGALLDTVGTHDTLEIFFSYDHNVPGESLEDLTFLDRFPNLQTLAVHIVPGTDLTPVETKTSLTALEVYTDGDDLLDVSQLTGLNSLRFWVPREGTLNLETSADLPNLRILDLFGGMGGPPVLSFVDHAPDLEFLKLQSVPDTDLTPLARLANLRAIILDWASPLDLTPLTACPSLEACCIPALSGAAIPSGLPVMEGDPSAAYAIRQEIAQQAET